MSQQKRYYSHNNIDHHQQQQQQQHYQQIYHQNQNQNQVPLSHYQTNISEPIYSNSLPSYSHIAIKSEVHNSNVNNNQQPVYHIMESTRDNPMLTQSVPIPCTGKMLSDFNDFTFDFDQSQSPQMTQDGIYIPSSSALFGLQNSNSNSNSNSNAMWNIINESMITKQEPFQMDDDDIFQVDKSDLFQSPTLAELNGDATLEDLNLDDLILPSENTGLTILSNATMNMQGNSFNDSTMPPQQLLQTTQTQINLATNQMQIEHQQQQHQHQQNDANQLFGQGIAVGRDALLYDEQTNISSTSPYDIYQANTPKTLNSNAAFSPDSHGSSSSPLLHNSISPPPYILNNNTITHNNNNTNNNKLQYTTLQDLLKQESPDRTNSKLGQSVPGPSSLTGAVRNRHENYHQRRLQFAHQHSGGNSCLSSSAPANSSGWPQQMWQRREPRQHLLSTGSLAEAGSTSSLSTGGIVSPEANDFSHDEGYEDSDSDHYEDYSTDDDSGNEDNTNPKGSKKERYFWQYNVQAKGPKGQRLVIKTQVEDPHVLNEVTDPVFSPSCSVRGIKHSGKARKGDGNDLTPNPRKLQCIGRELDKLGRTINQMTSVNESPFKERPKLRKEKNKLASRACRLKKKAQHEANKIKLYGLETEHKRLISGIEDVKKALAYKYSHLTENTEEVNTQIDNYVVAATKFQIAGTSTEFVNKVLEKVKCGIPNGGLSEI